MKKKGVDVGGKRKEERREGRREAKKKEEVGVRNTGTGKRREEGRGK